MEVLLEVGRFDMDGGVELTMIHTYIDVSLPLQLMKAAVPAESYI